MDPGERPLIDHTTFLAGEPFLSPRTITHLLQGTFDISSPIHFFTRHHLLTSHLPTVSLRPPETAARLAGHRISLPPAPPPPVITMHHHSQCSTAKAIAKGTGKGLWINRLMSKRVWQVAREGG